MSENLLTPNKFLRKKSHKKNSFKVNNQNIIEEEESLIAEIAPKPKEGVTSILLLLALSIHSCFEGIAIGLQGNPSEIFYMFLAVSFHKWVEALSIGINLNNSKIERSYLVKFIIMFSLTTPFGMLIGMFFSGTSELIEAVFLSISAGKKRCNLLLGSFIYISASEIVIEEFSVSKFKKEKFIALIIGACIICILTMLEHPH